MHGTFQIFKIYLRLGCLSFGGPAAHMAYFRDEFVDRRAWLTDARYAELLGLCQFIPGPSSSQLGFAIGWQRGGISGACAAWLGFTLPSALIMMGFAYGLYALGSEIDAFVQGLLIAAVAVVAKATLSMGKKLCPDWPHLALAAFSTAVVLFVPGAWIQILVIGIGVIAGQWLGRTDQAAMTGEIPRPRRTKHSPLSLALILYGLLLALSLWAPANSAGQLYALHYKAGALVFGGGHVVLPLLNESVVAGELVSEKDFLAGYSAAQALPGPLFTLSAFLGTTAGVTQPAALGGLLALIAIFLPGMLLLIGILPYWERLRRMPKAQAGLSGANAAVVGLLLAAFIDPVWTNGIGSAFDLLLAGAAFLLLYKFKAPAWATVLGCGLIGHLYQLL